MMKTLLLILIILTFYKHVLCYMRVCYYTNLSQYRPNGAKFTAENINPFLCSHIIYAFAKLDGNNLGAYEWNDLSTEFTEGMYSKVNKHKERNPELKILLAVGGWSTGSPPFSNMSLTGATRRHFINSTVYFLRQSNFDGIDIDWEYPARRGGRPEDRHNLVLLLSELKIAFEQNSYQMGLPRLLLSASVPAGKGNIDAGFDIPNVVRSLDFINIMTYDLHGSWDPLTGHNSPLYGRADESHEDALLNMNWAVKYWIRMGAPRHKILAGIGLYGRSFTLQTPANTGFGLGVPTLGAGRPGIYTREPGFLSFYEVCQELASGATRVWNDEHKVPYLYNGDQWVGYDDEQSVREKTQWAMKNNLGGIMVWSLDVDDFNGEFCNKGRYPLLTAINNELGVFKPTLVRPDAIDNFKLTVLSEDPINIHANPQRNLAVDADRNINRGHSTSGQAVQHASGLPIVKSNTGDRARLSQVPIEPLQPTPAAFVIPATTTTGIEEMPIAPVRQEISTHSLNMGSGTNNTFPSDFNGMLADNFNMSKTLQSIPLNLIHDHPPEVIRIGRVTKHGRPSMHHARPDSIHEMNPDGHLEGTAVVLPEPVHGSRQTGILPRTSARREGILLSDVRLAPSARPFFDVSSNSSLSLSSSVSKSDNRDIYFNGGQFSGLGTNLKDLFQHNPVSGSSSSATGSTAASAGSSESTPIDRGNSLISVKVINKTSNKSLPPGSSTSRVSTSRSANTRNTDHVIQELDLFNNILRGASFVGGSAGGVSSGSISGSASDVIPIGSAVSQPQHRGLDLFGFHGDDRNLLRPPSQRDHAVQLHSRPQPASNSPGDLRTLLGLSNPLGNLDSALLSPTRAPMSRAPSRQDLNNIPDGASLGEESVVGVSSGSIIGRTSGAIPIGSAVSQPQQHGVDLIGIHGVDMSLLQTRAQSDSHMKLHQRPQPLSNSHAKLRALLGLTNPLGSLESALLSPTSAPMARAPSRPDLNNIPDGASLGWESVGGVSSGSIRGSASGVIPIESAVSQPQHHGVDLLGIHGVNRNLSHPPSQSDHAVKEHQRPQPASHSPADFRALLGLTNPMGSLDSALLSPTRAPMARAPIRQGLSNNLGVDSFGGGSFVGVRGESIPGIETGNIPIGSAVLQPQHHGFDLHGIHGVDRNSSRLSSQRDHTMQLHSRPQQASNSSEDLRALLGLNNPLGSLESDLLSPTSADMARASTRPDFINIPDSASLRGRSIIGVSSGSITGSATGNIPIGSAVSQPQHTGLDLRGIHGIESNLSRMSSQSDHAMLLHSRPQQASNSSEDLRALLGLTNPLGSLDSDLLSPTTAAMARAPIRPNFSNIPDGASFSGGGIGGVSSGSIGGGASGVIHRGSAVSQPQHPGLDLRGIHGIERNLSRLSSHSDHAMQLPSRPKQASNSSGDLRALLGLTNPLGSLDSARISPTRAPNARAPSRDLVSPSLTIQRQPLVQQTPQNVDRIRQEVLLLQQIQNAILTRQRLASPQQTAPRTDQLSLRVPAPATLAPVINTRALQLAQQRAREQAALRQQQQQRDQLQQQQREQLLQQQQQQQQREQLLQQQQQQRREQLLQQQQQQQRGQVLQQQQQQQREQPLQQQRQQQQQIRTTDLHQLNDEQLRRVLNRLDMPTLRWMINSGPLSSTTNVERPTPLAAQPQRHNRSSGV